ncbi:hypothetical protein NW756_004807 [Fusarium oxysporum]|nr:hypothetical protein NW763_011347 [Fusarium oxysporum]KAJ4095987.1 hypothetical protein NW756_004807 [Fusarium oxysporum]
MGLDDLQTGLNGAAGGFFNFGQKTVPLLLDSVASSPSPPTLILTGATASMKASSQFSSFAAGRFAMRALGQSLAREFGPKGVHVAHAVIDGLINTPASRAWNSGGKPARSRQNRSPKRTGICTHNIGLHSLKRLTLDPTRRAFSSYIENASEFYHRIYTRLFRDSGKAKPCSRYHD